MYACPKCQSDRVIHNGSAAGKPKKQCQQCGNQFTRMTPRGEPLTMKVNAVLLMPSLTGDSRTCTRVPAEERCCAPVALQRLQGLACLVDARVRGTQRCARRDCHAVLRKRRRPHPLRGGRLRLPAAAHPRRRAELDDRLPHEPRRSTRSRSSRASTAASRRTCATPTAASPPARSRSTGPGTPTPTTSSA